MHFSGSDEMSPEMTYAKEQIEREERKLDQYKKKLDFEEQEQLKREEQILRRQKGETDKLRTVLSRQLDSFIQSQLRAVQQAEDKIGRSKAELQHLFAELEGARQSYDREHKETGRGEEKRNQRKESAQDEFSRSPEVIRINDQMQQVRRHIDEHMKSLTYLKREAVKQQEIFARNQKREFEKIQRQLEREKNGFDDSWKRAKKFLEDKVKMTESMLNRLKSDYEAEERQYKIELQRKQKLDSEQRAKFGDDKANKNFASADGEVTTEDVNENFSKTNSRRRMGGARW